jgi:hypothetical protein
MDREISVRSSIESRKAVENARDDNSDARVVLMCGRGARCKT